jgi:hypothetical protein
MASAGEASEGGVRLLLVGSPPDVTRVEAAAEACVAARRHLLVLFRGDAAGEGPGARDDDRDDEAREEASRRKKGDVVTIETRGRRATWSPRATPSRASRPCWSSRLY